MKSVFMLAVPYEGMLAPAFTTREEAEKYWSDSLSWDDETKVIEIKVRTSAKEESQ